MAETKKRALITRTYSVDREHMSQFADVAAGRGLSISSLLRLVIAQFLDRDERIAV